MTIARVTARWSGFPGAPGYSNFYFEVAGNAEEVQGRPQLVADFFEGVSVWLPNVVTITVEQELALIDEASGQVLGYEAVEDPPAEITGANTPSGNTHAGPSGAVVNWETGGVNNGRRVRGRTFLVPLNGGAYATDGTLISNALSQIRAAAGTLVGPDAGMVVWSRPGAGAGAVFPVTNARVPDLAAVLRSRRD